MRIVKTTIYIVLMFLLVLFVPLTAYADETEEPNPEETDLQIRVETITQRSYAGTAVTDRYNTTILTAESYEQAREIAARQEQEHITALASLFTASDDISQDNSVSETVERLGLFGDNYTLTNTKPAQSVKTNNTWVTVLVLAIGAGAGGILAVAIQKRKGGQSE